MGHAPGPLDEEAVGLSVGVPADGAADRVGGAPTDPEGGQAPAVDQALVQAVVGHQHRPLEPEVVEVAPVGTQRVGQVVPPPAPHPFGFGLTFGHGLQPAGHLLDGRGPPQVGPPRGQGADRQVLVGVDEARAQGAPRQVDPLGTGVAIEQVGPTHGGQPPVVADDDHLRRGPPTGHGEDPATVEGDQRSSASMASMEAARISTIWSATSVSMHNGGATPTTSMPMARA